MMRNMLTFFGFVAATKPRTRIDAFIWCVVCACIAGGWSLFAYAPAARAQSTAATTWTVSIVLPSRMVAGEPATLAVLGVDGRLADGITVDVGEGQHVKTDKSGRAFFTAPTDVTVLIVSAAGNSAAALIDAPTTGMGEQASIVAPVVSQVDRFSICGGGFRRRGRESREHQWRPRVRARCFAGMHCGAGEPARASRPGEIID